MTDEQDENTRVDPEGVACPECGRFFTRQGLSLHRYRIHKVGGKDDSNGRPRGRVRLDDSTPRVDLGREIDRTVESLATIGMMAYPFIPHVGAFIVSRAGKWEQTIPGQEKAVPKKGIATIWGEYAERDPRILRAMVRFNNLVHGSDVLELGIGFGMAAAVDVHVVSPDLAVRLPGMPPEMPPMQPIRMFIGDVIDQVAADRGPLPEFQPETYPEMSEAPV